MIKLKTLVNEGMMELPFETYKEIADHILQYYKKAKAANVTRVTQKSFPDRKFYLDLSNTKYAELMRLDPKPTVVINVTKNDPDAVGYYHEWHPETREYLLRQNSGFINIDIRPKNKNVNSVMDAIFETLEHELLHHIQQLYKKNKKIKFGMSKSVADTDEHGYSNKGTKQKRIKHHLRPIEWQTNLNSLIRSMELNYSKLKRGGAEVPSKEKFFRDKIRSSIYHIKNEELRKAYIKASYDYFVNGNRDMSSIHDKYYSDASDIQVEPTKPKSTNKLIQSIMDIPMFKDGKSLSDYHQYENKVANMHEYIKEEFQEIAKSLAPSNAGGNEKETDALDFVADGVDNWDWRDYWQYGMPIKIPYLKIKDSHWDGAVKFTIDPKKVAGVFKKVMKSDEPEWFKRAVVYFYIKEVLQRGYTREGISTEEMSNYFDKLKKLV